MGCISSKEMMRSATYHRNGMKGGSRRTSKGVPGLPEDLVTRRNHNHFLALVCTATSMTDALRPKSLRFESLVSPAETEGNESILKVDMLDDKDRGIVECKGLPDPPKRSRSWHSFPSEETLGGDKENNGVNIDSSEVNGKGATRSRSFHTVEEYNKLLQRIWSVSLADKDDMEADPAEKDASMAPLSMNCHAESNYQNSQETFQLRGNGSIAGESSTENEASKEISPGESTSGSESKGREEPVLVEETDTLSESCFENNDTHERSVTAKGFKRKTIARGLETLQIPRTFELPAVASLREWLPAGQVFSPGAHPTTKFGSYLVPTETTRKGNKETVFDEDLVTVLEEQLQQLKAEEETILEHITSTWQVSASTGMKECESTS